MLYSEIVLYSTVKVLDDVIECFLEFIELIPISIQLSTEKN